MNLNKLLLRRVAVARGLPEMLGGRGGAAAAHLLFGKHQGCYGQQHGHHSEQQQGRPLPVRGAGRGGGVVYG